MLPISEHAPVETVLLCAPVVLQVTPGPGVRLLRNVALAAAFFGTAPAGEFAAVIESVAAGAMLTMIAQTTLAEAYMRRMGGSWGRRY